MTGLIIVFVLLSLVVAAVCAPMLVKAREVSREDADEESAEEKPLADSEDAPEPVKKRTLKEAEALITELQDHIAQGDKIIERQADELQAKDATVQHQAQMLIKRHEEIADLKKKVEGEKSFALPSPIGNVGFVPPSVVITEEGVPGCVAGRVVYYTPTEDEHFIATADYPLVGLLVHVADKSIGRVNIHLLPDGDNQNPQGLRPWVTSRIYDANGAPGTWRFTR